MAAVEATVRELDAEGKQTLLVFNKIDAVPDPMVVEETVRRYPGSVAISARTGEGMDSFIGELEYRLSAWRMRVEFRISTSESATLAELHRIGHVLSVRYEGDDALVIAHVPPRQRPLRRLRSRDGRLARTVDGNRRIACVRERALIRHPHVRFLPRVVFSSNPFVHACARHAGNRLQAHAQRQELDLSGPWKFVRHDVAPDAPFEKWGSVMLPHTWNALDGQNGKAVDPDQPTGYYRGPGWYARTIEIPESWAGRRIFVKFDAASLVADVFLNGRRLGEHRGGFGAFVFEITDCAKPGGENVLRVKVSNAPVEDVAPLSGDFTICGGLYRPVHVFSTDATCIAPTDHGSSGVFLSQKEVTPARARVQADVMLSSREADDVEVVAELLDAAGKVVQTASVPAHVASGAKENDFTKATISLEIAAPHLWNGRTNPYLYHVRVKLRRDGRDIDEVTQPLGLRTVADHGGRGLSPQRSALSRSRRELPPGVDE